jgi:two-component system sensor histidine kinase ChvG
MAQAIASQMNESVQLEPQPLKRAASLTTRILAINIFVILLLVGGFLYLDSYRTRLVETRLLSLSHDAELAVVALDLSPPAADAEVVRRVAQETGTRIRRYDATGRLELDSFALAPPTYMLRDPTTQGWERQLARSLDRALDFVVGARFPGDYAEPAVDSASAWPELREAMRQPGQPATAYRFAPDRTPMLSVAIASPDAQAGLLLTVNARDITRTVRAERFRLGLVLAAVTALSVLLSLFLAQTIVRPLRRLASAAVRVRQGRAREVVVPRLPDRLDEIGMLARALSDMTQALRQRIDAGEHLAADIAHELKNPLASLRSALEGLERIEDPALRRQLMDVAQDDVRRLDRLITDISEASRIDAELSRTRFVPIDIGQLIEPILEARRARARDGAPAIAFARPRVGTARIMGEPSRLVRVFENLLDNAISFSPPGGVVRISATCADEAIIVRVEDDGPGVPDDQRELIFRRFHSVRPESEGFAQHSGLGLAIARAIIEAHDGQIRAVDREGASQGACFEIRLPAAAGSDR